MAFDINRKEEPVANTSDRTLYLTADKSEVVEEGDERAAFLLVRAGSELDPVAAKKYGIKSTDKAEDKAVAVPEEDKTADAEESDGEGDGELSCPQCDFVAKSAGGLTRHVNSQHEG